MKWVRVRWFLAACTLLLSIHEFALAFEIEAAHTDTPMRGMPTAAPVLFGTALFLATLLLIAPDTARRLAEWCARPFATIIYPSDEFSKPPLNYKLARHYRQTQRWEDAARQYRKIIRYYPKEKDAYVELLDVAKQLGDHDITHKYKALYRKRFKEDLPSTTA